MIVSLVWRSCLCFYLFSSVRCLEGCQSWVYRPNVQARIQMQSVRRAATEFPVRQIWTDQSPQPRLTPSFGKQEHVPLVRFCCAR